MCPTLRSPRIWEKGRAETGQRKRIISDMTRKWSWCYRGKKGADGTYFPRDASRKNTQLHKPPRQIPEKKKRNQERNHNKSANKARNSVLEKTHNKWTQRRFAIGNCFPPVQVPIIASKCRATPPPRTQSQHLSLFSSSPKACGGRFSFCSEEDATLGTLGVYIGGGGGRKIQDQGAGDPGVMEGEKLANGKRSTDGTR